jgi:hypothetical protein
MFKNVMMVEEVKPAWIEYDLMVRVIRLRLLKTVKAFTSQYHGVERITPAIRKEIELYSSYRQWKKPNLVVVLDA